jgi:2-oxoglutarate ferredoxin oxidoreductase subunit beta
MNEMTSIKTTLKDWESDQEVRWCPVAATMRS